MGSGQIKVGIVGASGYAGGELVRLLSRHPEARIVELQARGRESDPIAATQLVPDLLERGLAVIDLGPDFRLKDPADYPRWYGFDHPAPDLLAKAVYGLPELHRADLEAAAESTVRLLASPGCYSTSAILSLAPLARAGL